MGNMQERLETAVSQTEIDSGLFHNIVHGTETQTVSTENGDVPSVSKAIKDIRDSIHGQTSDLVGIAQNAAETATQKAVICTQNAQEASNAVAIAQQELINTQNEAQKAKIWAEGSDAEVETYGGEHSCKEWVMLARKATIGSFPQTTYGIATNQQTVLNLNTEGKLSNINQILAVIVENTILLPETYNLSEDGKSIILNNPLENQERWCVRFLHDIQSITSIIDSVIYEEM